MPHIVGMRFERGMSFDKIFKELVTKDDLYLETNEPLVNEIEEREGRKIEGDLEHVMRWAMDSLVSAEISKNRDTNKPPYHIKLKFEAVDKQKFKIDNLSGYSVSIRPLQCSNALKKIGKNGMSLQWDLELEELSEFYVIEVEMTSEPSHKKTGVCKVATNGLQRFLEQRKERIVSSIVNRNTVMQYIDMILSDFPEYTFENWNQRRTQTGMTTTGNSGLWDGVAIYEQLLKASYENPSKLEELQKVLPNLPENEYPKGLKSILDAFGITVKRKKKQ